MADCRNSARKQAPWTFRRRIVIYTLAFCASCVVHVMVKGAASSADAIVSGCFTLAGMVIGSYVFGAVWSDKTKNSEDEKE